MSPTIPRLSTIAALLLAASAAPGAPDGASHAARTQVAGDSGAIELGTGALPIADIVKRTNHAAYYQGKDGRARVKMTITDRSGGTRIREFTLLRANAPGSAEGDQKYYAYFHAPADLSKMVFIVHKHLGQDDDRWLYVPSLDLAKRIAASDKRTSFVGSNFFYEDVSGRSIDEDDHKLVKVTDNYFVTEHTPKRASSVEFSKYVMHVHRGTFLPTQVEYFSKSGKTYRKMSVDKVETIQGKPTVTKATLRDLQAGTSTVLEFSGIEYDLGIEDKIFSERYLRRAPRAYLDR